MQERLQKLLFRRYCSTQGSSCSNILCLLTRSEVCVGCLCCVVLHDPGDCLVLALSLLHWLSIGVSGWQAMVSRRREGVRGSWVRSVRNEFSQERSRLMEGRNGFVNSVLSPTISRQGCGRKYKQAVAAKTGDWSTNCSSSSGEEDEKSKRQEAEIKELREQVQWFRNNKEKQVRRGKVARPKRESGLEEDWGVEVEEESENGENKGKMHQR